MRWGRWGQRETEMETERKEAGKVRPFLPPTPLPGPVLPA
jgi:hypothetical protein